MHSVDYSVKLSICLSCRLSLGCKQCQVDWRHLLCLVWDTMEYWPRWRESSETVLRRRCRGPSADDRRETCQWRLCE